MYIFPMGGEGDVESEKGFKVWLVFNDVVVDVGQLKRLLPDLDVENLEGGAC
jgi:hypothetical protein